MTASERIIEESPHPLFPEARGSAAPWIPADEDVRDVIDVLRLDYPRVVEHDGLAEAA